MNNKLNSANRSANTIAVRILIASSAAGLVLIQQPKAYACGDGRIAEPYQEVCDKAQNFSSAAGDLADDLSSLGTSSKGFVSVVSSLRAMSKAASTLGFLGAGVAVAEIFLPAPEDPVLKEVTRLNGKIDRLSSSIDIEFGQADTHRDFIALESKFDAFENKISAVYKDWQIYSNSKTPSSTSIGMQSIPNLREAANGLATLCSTNDTYNTLEKYSYGELPWISLWISRMSVLIAQAQQVDSMLHYLHVSPNQSASPKEKTQLISNANSNTKDFYSGMIEGCAKALEASEERLLKTSTIKTYSTQFINNEILKDANKAQWNRPGIAKSIATSLKSKYPTREWLAISYVKPTVSDVKLIRFTNDSSEYFIKKDVGNDQSRRFIIHRWSTKTPKFPTSLWGTLIGNKLASEECVKKIKNHLVDLCVQRRRQTPIKENENVEYYFRSSPRVHEFYWIGRLEPGQEADFYTTTNSGVYKSLRSDGGISQIARMRSSKEGICGKKNSAAKMRLCTKDIGGTWMAYPTF